MKKNPKTFEKLVNDAINEVFARYANDAEALNNYAFGWRYFDSERMSYYIGSNHGQAFHYADEIAKIAEACGMSWYISIGTNGDGEPTSVISVC